MARIAEQFPDLRYPGLPPRLYINRLRRLCELRLAKLSISNTSDVLALCDELGRQRGRPIRLVPVAMRVSRPCGLWIMTEDTDFICYEAETTKFHQQHIIYHEIGHILCNHRGTGPVDAATARQLFPDLDTGLVRDMLGRTGYGDTQEQEAEMMASLIQASSPRHPVPKPGRGFLGSLAAVLGLG